MKINALVLAGGQIKDFKEAGPKAFLPLGTGIMLNHVLRALKESQSVNKIAITSIPRGASFEDDDIEIFPTKKEFIDSIITALEGLPEGKTLLMASDIPLTTSEMIDKFVDECLKSENDLYYPLIPKESVMKKYPTTKRTYFTLKDGTFTGGNIIMVKNDLFIKNKELAIKTYANRKKPLKLVKMLGIKFLYRFLRKKVTIADAENKASQIIGGKAKAVIFPYPELGTDVDKKADYDLMQALMNHGTS
jgi:GTP:adenosylcobinamide-phosphate guanylyltransferase